MENRITIGIFTDVYFPMVDGVVHVVDNYARSLLQYAEVYVFSPNYGVSSEHPTPPYHLVQTRSVKVPTTDYRTTIPFIDGDFKRRLKKIKLDIIHVHSPFSMGNYGIKYAKQHHIPVVATLHSQYQQDIFARIRNNFMTKLAMKQLMKRINDCDLLFTVNNRIAQVYFEHGVRIVPIVIENATDLLPCDNDELVKTLKEKHGLRDDEKILLFVGRIDKIKNLDFLVESLFELKNRDYKFKMIFIGSGPYQDDLQEKIAYFRLDHEVIMTGRITDRALLAAYYKTADLFLFPSLYDTSSLVQVEAASQSTPTLFIKGAITASSIGDGFNGYLSVEQPTEFANKIIDIFGDISQYNAVSNNSFETLYLTWQGIAEKLMTYYSRLIDIARK